MATETILPAIPSPAIDLPKAKVIKAAFLILPFATGKE